MGAEVATLQDVVIPARGHLATRLDRGQVLRVVDVEGQQVLDLVAVSADDPREKLSCILSNLFNNTWRLTRGHALYTSRSRPMLAITDDRVGIHHSGGGFCSEESNFLRYGVRGTPNCRHNLERAMAEHGLGSDLLEYDACFNVFMNLEYRPDGGFGIAAPRSTAGDHVELRAEMDCLLALSNCAQERNPCNAYCPTPLRVVVLQASD
jgi:uncharacterized protein YcgI (DUF1989 family)